MESVVSKRNPPQWGFGGIPSGVDVQSAPGESSRHVPRSHAKGQVTLQMILSRVLAHRRPDWPLTVLFVGLPIWWLLGVWQIMFFVVAIPMAIFLLKQRIIEMPRGFGVWLIWLAWILTGAFVIQVDAPGTALGAEMSRYLTFGYRFGWYVIATVVALYVLNIRRSISSELIIRNVAWLFVMMVGGGILGIAVPTLSFPSALQALLPSSIGKEPFVADLIHVQVAQIQGFLGYDEARPSAPFAYTNEWALAIVSTLPFFVVSWWARGRAWRFAMFPVLGLGVFAIVSSLNRGAWLAIVVVVAFVIIRAAARGHFRMLFVSIAIIAAAGTVLMFSPLGDLVIARFDNPHSNEGRANLGLTTVLATAEGSPIVGFGTTRDLIGNFASIAGGATADCPKCSPPPLGTQGQLWSVIFGAGFIGLILFVWFLLRQILSNLRVTSPYALAAVCCLLVLVVTMPVYASWGIGLYVGLIGVAVIARESPNGLPTLNNALRPVLRHAPAILVASTIGLFVGAGLHAVQGTPSTATTRILVPAGDLVGVPGARPTSLDSDAAIVTSRPVIALVSEKLGKPPHKVQSSLEVGAEPNTRVLLVSYTSSDEAEALQGSSYASDAYLSERRKLLAAANVSVQVRYGAREDALDEIYRQTRATLTSSNGDFLGATMSQVRADRAAASDLLFNVNDSSAGQVVSPAAIRSSNSLLIVRLASGIALGALAGLGIMLLYDRYGMPVGRRPGRRLDIDLPVVAWISPSAAVSGATLLRAYLPLAGIAPDPSSHRARKVASQLEASLDHQGFGGDTALLVAGTRSRAGTVRKEYARYVKMGIRPVGLIMTTSSQRRRPRRQSSRNASS